MGVSEDTLEQARQWGREDAKDAIILARAHSHRPARRLVSDWDGIEAALPDVKEGESVSFGVLGRDCPLAALLPGGKKAWEAGLQEADAAGEDEEELGTRSPDRPRRRVLPRS